MLRKIQISVLLFCLISFFSFSELSKVSYEFSQEPIDVVIPCAAKDLQTLNYCLDGIKKYGKNIRRIIVVSKKKLTDKAEWFPEDKFPFTFYDIALQILKNPIKAREHAAAKKNRLGWLFQQLVKFYSPYVIEDISSNVFVLDADVIFLKEVDLCNQETGAAYFNTSDENWNEYFEHARRLVPGFVRIHEKCSGICHCMLMQRSVLDNLFKVVENHHHKEFWRAFCDCINLDYLKLSSASEYEIYFNFAFLTSDQFIIRNLKWKDAGSLFHFKSKLKRHNNSGLHYVAYPSYWRKYYLKYL